MVGGAAGEAVSAGGNGLASVTESVVTPLAGFASGRSVVTLLAGFGSAFLPQRPGGRNGMPAAFKYPPAVSRRTPVAFSI
jgi:hypothetical protein